MLGVKSNFENKYHDVKCPNCSEEDTQSHLSFCDKLVLSAHNHRRFVCIVIEISSIYGLQAKVKTDTVRCLQPLHALQM